MHIKVLIALLLLAGVALAANVQCWNGTVGAVSWWTHDNADYAAPLTQDKCGRNDLTDGNAPNTGQAGVFNEGYDYEKTNSDYIYNAVTDASLTPNGNISIVYWFEPESETNGDYIMQFGDSDGATPNHISHRYYGAGNEWIYQIRTSNADYRYYDDGDIQEIGDLYHVVMVWGDTNLTLYLNGTQRALSVTLQAGAIPDSANLNDNENFALAAEWNDVAHAAFGDASLVDEVSIYNYSLSATEVSELFNNNRVGESTASSAAYGEISDTFTTPIYETNDTDFNYSFWYNSTNITAVDVALHWNFTDMSYTSSGNSTLGDNVTIWFAYENFTMPLVETNYTNISTWWRYNITWVNATTHVLNATNHTQAIYHAYYWDDYYPTILALSGQSIYLRGNITDLMSRAAYSVWAEFNATNFTMISSSPHYNITTAPTITINSSNYTSNATFNASYTSPDYGGARVYNRISENESTAVYLLQIGNCSGLFNTTVLNYTCYNETSVNSRSVCRLESTFFVWADASQTGLNTTFSNNRTGLNSYTFCLYPTWATAYVNSWQGYENTTWSDYRAYFLDNATVTNTTSYVSLYLLDAADDILTSVTLNDQYSTPYEDAYLYFNRYYVEENQYRTIAMCRTDEDGGCNTYLEPNDVWYRIQVIKDHTVQYTFSPQTLSCDPADQICSLTLTMTESGSYGEYFDYWDNVAYSCAFSNITNITSCTITDTSGLMQYSRLLVYQVGLFAPILECDTNSSAASATLTCTHINPSGDYQYYLVAHFYDEDILTSGTFSTGSPTTFGEAGVFGTIIIVVALAFIGLWSAPVAILLAFIGLLISYALQMFWISLSSLVAIGVVAILLIYKTR